MLPITGSPHDTGIVVGKGNRRGRGGEEKGEGKQREKRRGLRGKGKQGKKRS